MSHPTILAAGSVALTLVLVACGTDVPRGEPGPPVTPPAVESLPAPWSAPELREVVELQVLRDGPALRERLTAGDPAVRARAAFALASVQDEGAAPALAALLDDPDPAVRREAAFSLGQISLPGGGGALVEALRAEEEPAVRRRLVEALGKGGGPDAVHALTELEPRDPVEAAHLALALSRAAHRQVAVPGLQDAIAERLTHPEAAVRRNAAYHYARPPDPDAWVEQLPRLREALDGYPLDEPAAMYVLMGLGVHRDPADRERFLRWMGEATDWRIRVNAARATGTTAMLEVEGVRDALFGLVEHDPSLHVAQAAAQTLTMGFLVPDPAVERMARILESGDARRWRAHLPFVEELVAHDRSDAIRAWARRMEREDPEALIRALRVLARPLGPDEATAFIERATGHRSAQVRAAALTALAGRWTTVPTHEARYREAMERFHAALSRGEPVEVVAVTRALMHPAWIPFGSSETLEEGLRGLAPDAPFFVVLAYLEALAAVGGGDAAELAEGYAEHDHSRVRAAAGETIRTLTGRTVPGTGLPVPERAVDWAALEALGSAPRLHLETDAGEIVVRLAPDQAPLTVQVIAGLVEEGAYAGSPFHRVIPNFVIQGGDVTLKDGTGSAGFAMRSEFTRLPFQRGVLGMASSGKDTEGSQFFITHAMQPHLDGGYTAFGWVESGEAALDGVLEGDRIRSARIVPGGPP